MLLFALRDDLGAQPKKIVDDDHAAKMARGLAVFKDKVRPVLLQQCLHCHGGKTTEGELDLSDRDRLLKGGNSGPAFVSGDAKKSLLVKLVHHEKKPVMPHEGKKLPEETLKQIALWIDLGAPYDAPLIKREDALAWTKKTIDPSARGHWSFQPLQRVNPPAVKNEKWVRTPIDRFILARLDEKGIKPNDAATPRQLVRRAYFDLIGLPPSPEEVDEFLKDANADPHKAWEKLIDKLLASPRHGERWARHWLDLVRFAESHGFEHDYDRPTAYHYRDFVIRALNQDLPFDTFVKWQLAGDEIAPKDNLALMATGYLAAGVHSTQITKNEVEKHRYDELDDILATTGTAMLGLTVGCARCHDHKFDAIPSRDYYRMLSTFTTTVRTEIDLDMDPEGYKKAKEAFDREHAPFASALKKFENEQLPTRFAAWQKEQAERPLPPSWVIPELGTFKSSGGATLAKQDDGSILITGKNPPIETLTIVVTTDMTAIAGVRLEAMSHPSLAKNGPGRAANGNFALTDFKVTASPKAGGKASEIKLKNPRSTFDQKGLPITAAIDADPVTSGWAIDPQFGKTHAAAFEFESPISHHSGTTLTFTLKFQNNVGHGIGKPRLTLTSATKPLALDATALPEAVHRLLRLPADKRSPEQMKLLTTWYRQLDPEWLKLNKQVQDHLSKAPKPATVKALIASEGLPPIRLHSQGEDFFKETHFLKRGDPSQKEGVAEPGFLQLATVVGAEKKWSPSVPEGSRLSYRRTAFANWMADVESGAGRLLARVIVNRLWQHHFGRGIVATPSDFGIRGEKPSHPELLDYLATELIRNGWHLKPIHKLIMMSAVYQEATTLDEARQKLDKDNTLLWHRPIRRLEAETIRDSLLAISDQLDLKMEGPGTLDEASKRRSIYFTMKRSKLIPSLIIFDAPDGTTGVGERPSTTIAPQALHLMNSKQVRDYAHGLAKRIAPTEKVELEQVIAKAYLITLAREPNPDEMKEGLSFIKQQILSYGGKDGARHLAVTDFCQVMMCLNEFVYVE
ncbi:MAG: PSD1 and planctomycete cytochrome C domain-containing protein [Planctomycetes bacterium]|nr:PSD1 and planctomycete cytochrome C domain-containing protein [Planctomycetota bacterium]